MAWETYYKEHLCSMEELLHRFPKEDATYITSHAAGEPKAINHAIAENFALFRNVTIFNLLVVGEAPYCRPEMEGHLRYRTIFAGSDTRAPIAEKRADYVPSIIISVLIISAVSSSPMWPYSMYRPLICTAGAALASPWISRWPPLRPPSWS